MVKRKSNKETKQEKVKKTVITQNDLVLDYLVESGRKGATNFEMMTRLAICDVRKCISDINKFPLEFSIESEYEISANGKRYKRYWAVPIEYQGDLTEWLLDEGKHTRKTSKKRTGGGAR